MAQSFERVLVAIPAYNEEATIAGVVRRIRASMPGFDLLVINDGITDSTPQNAKGPQSGYGPHLSILGYGRAIETAIKNAHEMNYDALLTLDAEGQHRPEYVQGLYRLSREGWIGFVNRFPLCSYARLLQRDYWQKNRNAAVLRRR